jgi:hypothetical protein
MKFLVLALLALSPAAFADGTYPSPDGKFVAQVQSEKNNEIFVTLSTKAGKTLAQINLLSQDSEHGRTLAKAAWSKDSRFFLFTTESSGGHSPWHDMAYFYSRASETFRSLDDRSGVSVASDNFSIDNTDVLHFQAYNFGTQTPEPASISLPHLESQRNP